jgi:hypothetical protein
MPLGITIPLDGFSLAEHADLAREAESLGYRDAWSFEADGVDAFAPLAVAASRRGCVWAPPSSTSSRAARPRSP